MSPDKKKLTFWSGATTIVNGYSELEAHEPTHAGGSGAPEEPARVDGTASAEEGTVVLELVASV
jgi:hypothetical protein